MTERTLRDQDISLFAVGNAILRNRWRIIRWAGIGVIIAALSVAFTQPVYQASASFVPQGNTSGTSGLAGLAGQLGVTLQTGNQSLSPDFYVSLIRSRELLSHITRDTLKVREMGNQRVSLLDLFKVESTEAQHREELGIRLLNALINPTLDKKTGTVRIDVSTRWPSVSLHIVSAILAGVNEYNQRIRQTQALAERKFLEGRLAEAGAALRLAEDKLEAFTRTNRQFSTSAQLVFENERLKRNLTLQQQVYSSLTQAYEDARIREVRDTPVITIFESPSVRTQPEPRGRAKRLLLGFIFGNLAGLVFAFAHGLIRTIQSENDPEGMQFLNSLREIWRSLYRPPWKKH